MAHLRSFIALAAALVVAMLAADAHAQKTLVLLDSPTTRETHTRFFSALEASGLTLKFVQADSTSLALEKYGERLFDNVLIFAPSVSQFGGSVTAESVAEFVNHGGNVLVAADSTIAASITNLGFEFGFQFGEKGSSVFDHFSNNGEATTILSSNTLDVDIMTGSPSKPIAFNGVGLTADGDNSLVIPVLSASSTAFSANGASSSPASNGAFGSDVVLVGAMQARNNGRVVLSGSLDLFSDKFFADESTDNEKFATAIGLWCFGERGVLRKGQTVFRHKGQEENSREFTIKDEVYYALPIEQKVNGKWVPFAASDVQLEFHRMDAFVRRTLTNSNGVMETEFVLPDVYGVFQFRVDYERRGYTFLHDVEQVSVRPLLHTQYERFIVSAYPYYTSAFSMMVGFVIFSIVFLHHKNTDKKAESK